MKQIYLYIADIVILFLVVLGVVHSQNVNYPGLPANIAYTDVTNNFTAEQKFVARVDTADFSNSNTGAVTQNTQTGKIFCANTRIDALNHGDLTITNSFVTLSSIIVVTLEYVQAGDVDTYQFEWPVYGITPGTFHILPDPLSGVSFNGNFWLHYVVFNP